VVRLYNFHVNSLFKELLTEVITLFIKHHLLREAMMQLFFIHKVKFGGCMCAVVRERMLENNKVENK
jgi:hypothetical protein